MFLMKRFLSTGTVRSTSLLSATRRASFLSKASAVFRAMASSPIIVLSGPSGSGKSTILNKAMAQHPEKFAFSVSHTTRKPRPGEVDGVQYHFVSVETMEKMIEEGKFFEHAKFGGNLYGTSKKAVDDIQQSGKICVLDVDLQGVMNIKKSNLAAKYILITPPALDTLRKRLESRGTETKESIEKRLQAAEKDLEAVKKNADLFDYVVVNDELDEAFNKFMKLIVVDTGEHINSKVAA